MNCFSIKPSGRTSWTGTYYWILLEKYKLDLIQTMLHLHFKGFRNWVQGKDNAITGIHLTEMKMSCSREHKRLVLHSFTQEMKGNDAFSCSTRTLQRGFWGESALNWSLAGTPTPQCLRLSPTIHFQERGTILIQ